MDKKFEEKEFIAEERGWWFKSRREIINNLIRGKPKDIKILDVGCSNGEMISLLNKNGFNNVTGIDFSKEAIDECKKKGINEVYIMNACDIKLKNKFDVIIASDVLEHIEDDEFALSEFNKILKPKGQLILFIPAHKFLWTKLDEIAHHFRRYSKKELKDKLELFEINRISYWNFVLFFFKIFQNKKSEISSHYIQVDNKKINFGGFFNNLLLFWLRIENFFVKRINFPIGVSLFAICNKREKE